jgi:hypothetical protein
LFSTKEFIETSRDFVCVRLETYESIEHQDLIRSFLNGRMENTAFCILDPKAEDRLTRSSRSPSMVLGAQGRGPGATAGSNDIVIAEMKKLAADYRTRGDTDETVLQDFHSYHQALNVASGDQRLLVFVAAGERDQPAIRKNLEPVFADEAVVGRFHLDFGNADKDKEWASTLAKLKGNSGIIVIRSDEFGQEGEVVAQLPITAKAAEIKTTLLAANEKFADDEKRKVYSDHVAEGRREGITFETGIPYGEDRDGDGEIDHGSRKGKGGSKGGKGKGPR